MLKLSVDKPRFFLAFAKEARYGTDYKEKLKDKDPMIAKTLTTAAAAIALTATPVFAQEASIDRLPAPVDAQGEQLEGESGLIFALLAAAAIIAGIIILVDSGDDEVLPTSP